MTESDVGAEVLAGQGQEVLQYAVKFVCGRSEGEIVASGTYFTAINVHNPLYRDVRFRVKVAIGLPGLKSGLVSKFRDARLGPDGALEIDCRDVQSLAEHEADFMKGFVVIESVTELDVVGVYTAADRDGQVEALDIERVPARSRKVGGREVRVTFESPLAVGTQYGTPAGQSDGDVIFTSSGVVVTIHDFVFIGGGGTFGLAQVDLAPALNSTQSMRTNNVNLGFDFGAIGFVPTRVQFEFLDAGGSENLSVNGDPFVGDISAAPSTLGGVNISLSTTPAPGGRKGTVTLTGVVNQLMVGGQEFWIDNVCAFE